MYKQILILINIMYKQITIKNMKRKNDIVPIYQLRKKIQYFTCNISNFKHYNNVHELRVYRIYRKVPTYYTVLVLTGH